MPSAANEAPITPVRHSPAAPEITTFSTNKTTSGKRIAATAFVEILEHPPEYAHKDLMPLYSGARFTGNSRASGSAVVEFGAIVVEHDAGKNASNTRPMPIDEARRRLQEASVAAWAYTTPSHAPEAPRWRVVALLSAAVAPSEHAVLVETLNGLLDGTLAAESRDPARCWYYGRSKTATEYRCLRSDGAPLDVAMLFDDLPRAPLPAGGSRAVVALAALAPSPDGDTWAHEIDRAEALERIASDPETVADLRAALFYRLPDGSPPPGLDPDNRDDWIAVGHALKAAGLFDLWAEWSSQSAKWDDGRNDPERVWESLRGDHTNYPAIFAKAQAAGWTNPRKGRKPDDAPDMTDAGNAAVLLARAEGNLRYVVERRAWIAWDGERWAIDDAGTASMRDALGVANHWLEQARAIAQQAEAVTGADRKRLLAASESFRQWAAYCRSRRGLEAMLALATRDARATVRATDLDRDPNLLGVENGVVDLRTGELRPAGRDDFITRRAAVRYAPDARAPRWERFVEEITSTPDPTAAGRMRPRPAVAAFLRRVLGYAATGLTREHKLFIAVGGGSNGKSLLFDTLAAVLGPYFYALPPEAMMASQRESDPERPTPFARGLEGARFAVGSEAREGQQLSSAWVKRMTGDAKVTARGLHENARTFDATHTLFLLTNHQPPMDHLDGATRGRVICLPFDMAWNRPGVVDRDPTRPDGDKDLMRKLRDEAEGILAWLVRAAVDYYRDGLEPPDEVRNKTTDYFRDQDAFARWMSECEPCEAREGTAASELMAQFESWCIAEGMQDRRTSNGTAFAAALQSAGIQYIRTNRARLYGLRWVGPLAVR